MNPVFYADEYLGKIHLFSGCEAMRDVVAAQGKNLKWNPRSEWFSAAFLLASVFFLTGCNGKSKIETFCGELPDAQAEVIAFQAELTSYLPKPAGKKGVGPKRRLASVSVPEVPVAKPTDENRELWLNWTEKALKRTQWARDALETDPLGKKARAPLSDASLSLVSIHGYIDQLKWKKAAAELAKVDRSLKKAYEIACKTPQKP